MAERPGEGAPSGRRGGHAGRQQDGPRGGARGQLRGRPGTGHRVRGGEGVSLKHTCRTCARCVTCTCTRTLTRIRTHLHSPTRAQCCTPPHTLSHTPYTDTHHVHTHAHLHSPIQAQCHSPTHSTLTCMHMHPSAHCHTPIDHTHTRVHTCTYHYVWDQEHVRSCRKVARAIPGHTRGWRQREGGATQGPREGRPSGRGQPASLQVTWKTGRRQEGSEEHGGRAEGRRGGIRVSPLGCWRSTWGSPR